MSAELTAEVQRLGPLLHGRVLCDASDCKTAATHRVRVTVRGVAAYICVCDDHYDVLTKGE